VSAAWKSTAWASLVPSRTLTRGIHEQIVRRNHAKSKAGCISDIAAQPIISISGQLTQQVLRCVTQTSSRTTPCRTRASGPGVFVLNTTIDTTRHEMSTLILQNVSQSDIGNAFNGELFLLKHNSYIKMRQSRNKVRLVPSSALPCPAGLPLLHPTKLSDEIKTSYPTFHK